jgi:hydroxymethylpyrimidine kinase/phosphomethylpyrimidine kinase
MGGIDPTGGAGLDRDEATCRAVAPDVVPVRLVTATTRQGHGAPASARAVDPAALVEQARHKPEPAAIKVGLVPAAIAEAVARILAERDVPIVVDPVLRASDGGDLGARPDALASVLARARVITPNRPEAAALTGLAPDDPTLPDALARRFPDAWILLKDGHGRDPDRVADLLAGGGTDQRHVFARLRQPGPDRRGTGCALATAIACGLAHGTPVVDAVATAIAWLDRTRADLPSAGPRYPGR